jgi:hypothetical protein
MTVGYKIPTVKKTTNKFHCIISGTFEFMHHIKSDSSSILRNIFCQNKQVSVKKYISRDDC